MKATRRVRGLDEPAPSSTTHRVWYGALAKGKGALCQPLPTQRGLISKLLVIMQKIADYLMVFLQEKIADYLVVSLSEHGSLVSSLSPSRN